MKLAMKLRTRLFLSISALITVALLGLLLGLVSVMQMASSQEALVRNNFATLELGLKLRQTLGDQLMVMVSEKPDPVRFESARQHYIQLLDEGIALEQSGNGGPYGFEQAKDDYLDFLQAYGQASDPAKVLSGNEALTEKFNTLRNGLLTEHKRALDNITDTERQSRERALLVAGLLGLVGLAVLIIGFVTAHAIARRFGEPIEALAQAADNIGQGQGFDRLTKTSGNRVSRHKSNDQYRQPHQPQQASHQQCALTRLALGVGDVIQRTLVFCEQTIAHRIEFFRECFVATQHLGRVRGLAVGLEKIQIVVLGLFEPVRAAVAGMFEGNAFIEQLDVMLPGRFEPGRIGLLADHDHQLITQGLTQLQPQVEGGEVVANERFLGAGHLHHTDQPEQKPEQRHGDQCGNTQEQPSTQLHRQFHRLLLTNCIACVCGTGSKHQCPGSLPPDPVYRP